MAASLCKIASKRKPISRASAILILIATSPLFHAKEIRKPLMVIQGENDARVIKPESDDIVEAVRKNGVPVEYLVFADEGHGFSKKKKRHGSEPQNCGILGQVFEGQLTAAKLAAGGCIAAMYCANVLRQCIAAKYCGYLARVGIW